MEIEYALTVDDYQAAVRHLRRRNQQRRHVRQAKSRSWLWPVLIGLALATAWIFLDDQLLPILRVLWPFLVGFLAGIVALLLLASWSMRSHLHRKLRDERNLWVLGPRRFRLGADGIRSSGEHSSTWLAWSVVWDATATDEHMFFIFSSDMAHIVPRRAFADLQRWRDFVSLARRYWRGDEAPAREPQTGITTIPEALPADDLRDDPDLT
jgi:hypothetical protein